MPTIAFNQLKNNLNKFVANSSALLRTMVDTVELGYNNELEIGDPTNPFISLLEMSAACSVGNLEKLRSACKELYPNLSVEATELWRHMTNDDFIDPFSKPSKANFTLLLSYSEILSRAVDYIPGGYKKLVIPKHTRITVDNVPFTMQYPIEIRVLEHGGIIAVYNTDKVSPILTLDSNIITSFRTRIDNIDLLCLEFTVEQLNIATRNNIALTSATGFKKVYNYTDKYYYSRAFVSSDNVNWTEIPITLSEQVFDPLKLTMLAKVFDGSIEYQIPTTYFMNGLADGKNLRIWTYTTKGDYSANLAELPPNSFKTEFVDYDNDDNGIYSAPLNTFKTISTFANGVCSGGSNAISLDELRNRIIDNASGMPKFPITNDQLAVEWKDISFDIIKSIDNITDRQYIITRDLPDIVTALKADIDSNLLNSPAIAPLSLNIRTFNFNVEAIAGYKTVYDNGSRVTILPSTLYLETNGLVQPVDDSIRESFALMNSVDRATVVNMNKYSYSPFHYVLYPRVSTFEIRPFWMLAPAIIRKVFVADNDKLGLSASIKSYSIELTDTGYKMLVTTTSNAVFKDRIKTDVDSIVAQLSFLPAGSTRRVYANGVRLDPTSLYGNEQTVVPKDELLFQFDIRTTETNLGVTKGFDIDDDNNLQIKNFSMEDGIERNYASALENDFDLVLIDTKALPSTISSPIDSELGTWLLPTTSGEYRGFVRERFTFKFGSALEKLWRKSRTIVTEESYQKYTADVPATYDKDIYELDGDGNMAFVVVDDELTFNKLHSSGDPILDGDDQPIILHQVGDNVLDVDGNPILNDPRKINRLADLCLFEGIYYFADESSSVMYAKKIPTLISEWVNDTITGLNGKFLEQTNAIFFPKTSYGTIEAYVKDTGLVTMRAEQSFFFTFHVDKKIYEDTKLRNSIQTDVVSIVSKELKNAVISELSIMNQVELKLGNLIEGFKMSLFGDNKDITTFTLKDVTNYLNIGKRLEVLPDGRLTVQDDVDFEFILHDYTTK